MYDMYIQTIRHLAHRSILRPIGRLAGLLLLLAIFSAALPSWEVHAHADGDHNHGHMAQLAADYMLEHDEDDKPSSASSKDDVVFHMHDAGKTSVALLTVPAKLPDGALCATSDSLVVSLPISAVPLPPYRPPIA